MMVMGAKEPDPPGSYLDRTIVFSFSSSGEKGVTFGLHCQSQVFHSE